MPDKASGGEGRLDPRLASILQNLTEGVYTMDAQGRVVSANPAVLRILGYKSEDVLGKDAHDLFHATRAETAPHSREDCPQVRTIRDGSIHHIRGDHLRAHDGRLVQVDATLLPERDGDSVTGAVVILRESETQAGKALKESDERFRRLFDASEDGVAIARGGEILECNAALGRLFGVEPQGLVGASLGTLFSSEARDQVATRLRAGFEGLFEATALRSDGSRFAAAVYAKPVPYPGGTAHLTLFRDLTREGAHPGGEEPGLSRPLVRRIIHDLVEAGNVGHPTLQDAGRRLAEDTEAHDIRGFIDAYRTMGLGDLVLERSDEGRSTFHGSDLLEQRHGARTATCYFTLGFLGEVVSRVHRGAPTLGTETECQSRGSAHCTFVVQVRKPEEGIARRVKELV